MEILIPENFPLFSSILPPLYFIWIYKKQTLKNEKENQLFIAWTIFVYTE